MHSMEPLESHSTNRTVTPTTTNGNGEHVCIFSSRAIGERFLSSTK